MALGEDELCFYFYFVRLCVPSSRYTYTLDIFFHEITSLLIPIKYLPTTMIPPSQYDSIFDSFCNSYNLDRIFLVFNLEGNRYVLSHSCKKQTLAVSIIVTSQWVWRRLKSPASRLCLGPPTYQFVQAQIEENTKVLRYWPLWGEFTGDRWIPQTKDWSVTRKMFQFDDVIMIIQMIEAW